MAKYLDEELKKVRCKVKVRDEDSCDLVMWKKYEELNGKTFGEIQEYFKDIRKDRGWRGPGGYEAVSEIKRTLRGFIYVTSSFPSPDSEKNRTGGYIPRKTDYKVVPMNPLRNLHFA